MEKNKQCLCNTVQYFVQNIFKAMAVYKLKLVFIKRITVDYTSENAPSM